MTINLTKYQSEKLKLAILEKNQAEIRLNDITDLLIDFYNVEKGKTVQVSADYSSLIVQEVQLI